ncbi:hypothetical protein CFIMG_008723RA00001 [Ceratocystis fimbriata CBS 114723]|uniref:Uncharacterized protein n=1 Tax=Ceratocystis fimbriata CBS 114723 TaxID=1035309 RepID=A0A2C5X031_9PEZI|nr:hypothetical protein CFIMG_008723RA00001 [Ceratocystis fimbriata CBS 114723]
MSRPNSIDVELEIAAAARDPAPRGRAVGTTVAAALRPRPVRVGAGAGAGSSSISSITSSSSGITTCFVALPRGAAVFLADVLAAAVLAGAAVLLFPRSVAGAGCSFSDSIASSGAI